MRIWFEFKKLNLKMEKKKLKVFSNKIKKNYQNRKSNLKFSLRGVTKQKESKR